MIYNGLPLRHELKYYLPVADYFAMRGRLAAVLRPDENMTRPEGYHVRSLYFDDETFSDKQDKEAGIEKRSKTRIRIYDKSPEFIRFEKKIKISEYIGKKSAVISERDFFSILSGDIGFLLTKPDPVLHRFYADHKLRRLRPAVVVDYIREAYYHKNGNVRITFDRDLRAAVGDFNIFSDKGLTFFNVYPPQLLTMEVKYDDYLPASIKKIIHPYTARRSEISKYVLSLRALKGLSVWPN